MFTPDGRISRSELERVGERAEGGTRVLPSAAVYQSGPGETGSTLVSPEPTGRWVRITAGPLSLSQTLYSWKDVQDDGTGYGWADVPGGLTGTNTAAPSDEADNVPADPTTGAVVFIRPDDANPGFWKFEWFGGNNLTLKNGNTVIDTDCTTLISDVNNVVTFLNISPGVDRLVVAVATETQQGIVSTVADNWSGSKGTDGNFESHNSSTPSAFARLSYDLGPITGLGAGQFPGLQVENTGSANNLFWVFDTANNRAVLATGAASTPVYCLVDNTGALRTGVSGTGGAGDTFVGGICTALGAFPLTVSDGTTAVTHCTSIVFTSGAVVTNVGGAADVAIIGATATHGGNGVFGGYNTTTTMANSGLTMTLPSAGTYYIYGMCLGNISDTQANSAIVAQLQDATNATTISPTVPLITTQPAGGGNFPGHCTWAIEYTPANTPATINLQAQKTGGVGVTGSILSSSTLRYFRIA